MSKIQMDDIANNRVSTQKISTALFPAAFFASLARARRASLFPASSAAFFPATFIRFGYRGPCAALGFFGANTAFLIALLDVMRFTLLLGRVFLLASLRHRFLHLTFSDKQTDFRRPLDLTA